MDARPLAADRFFPRVPGGVVLSNGVSGGYAPLGAVIVAGRVFDACLEQGLIVYPCAGTLPDGTGDQILLAPPYIIGAGEIDDLAARLTRALSMAAATLPAMDSA